MRPSGKLIVVTTLLVLLGPRVASSEDGFLYVEGHVFNARTPTPLRGVQVSAFAPLDEISTPESGPAPIARSVTDQNGFFQLRVRNADSLRSESLYLHALCVVTDADGEFIAAAGGSAEAHPVEAERILRRDIYLELPRSFRRSTGCDPAGQLPGPSPVIGPPPDSLIR